MKTTKTIHVNLDKELHKKLRHHCVDEDVRVNAFIAELIKKFFEEQER